MGKNPTSTMSFSYPEVEWIHGPELDPFLPRLQSFVPKLKDHIWISSSGSSRNLRESKKWIALSREALRISADTVNRVFSISTGDRWALALPSHHIGGLSVMIRAELTGSKVLIWNQKWNPEKFCDFLKQNQVTRTSLVPTQIFDLVARQQRAPQKLETVFVGGSQLNPQLADQALALDWPLAASFGMTETCSQVATSQLKTSADLLRGLQVLPHMEVQIDSESCLWIRSKALMTGFAQIREEQFFWKPVELSNEGFWRSSDRAHLVDNRLVLLGREQDFVKVKGVGVNLSELSKRMAVPDSAVLLAIPEARQGNRLVLVSEPSWEKVVREQIRSWNQSCVSHEKIELVFVSKIPRNELGKVLFEELKSTIGPGQPSHENDDRLVANSTKLPEPTGLGAKNRKD